MDFKCSIYMAEIGPKLMLCVFYCNKMYVEPSSDFKLCFVVCFFNYTNY
jgi:hypothetical protein